MIVTYKKNLNKSLMIFSEYETVEYEENYLMKMLTQNNIKGLLPAEFQTVNSRPQISFDISYKHSLFSFLENSKINLDFLNVILRSLYDIFTQLEKYMLDSCYLCLNPDSIYMDLQTKKLYFAYSPIPESDVDYSLNFKLSGLFDYLLTKLDYTDQSCIATAFTLHKKITDNIFKLEDLTLSQSNSYEGIQREDFVPEKAEDNIISSDENNATVETVLSAKISDSKYILLGIKVLTYTLCSLILIVNLYLFFIAKKISPVLFIGLFALCFCIFFLTLPYFRNKSALNSYIRSHTAKEEKIIGSPVSCQVLDTVLINTPESALKPRLMFFGNLTDSVLPAEIPLDHFPFTIGKIPASSDTIINNPMISRLHARFHFHDSCYFVEDLNSSNGTFLNDNPLPPMTHTVIDDGDKLTFANISYVFKL